MMNPTWDVSFFSSSRTFAARSRWDRSNSRILTNALTTNTLMEGNVPFYEKRGYAVRSRTTPLPGVVLAHMSKTIEDDA